MSFLFDNIIPIILIISSIILFGLAITMKILEYIDKMKKKIILDLKKRMNAKVLYEHTIFDYLTELRDDISIRMNLGNPTKNAVFRHILVNNIDIFADMFVVECERIHNICPGKHKCNGTCVINPIDLLNHNIRQFHDTYDHFKIFFVNEEYNDEELELLKYSIPIFDSDGDIAMTMVEETVNSLRDNQEYGFCAIQHTIEILDTSETAFKQTPHQVEEALKKANGHYDNKKFKERKYFKPQWQKKLFKLNNDKNK